MIVYLSTQKNDSSGSATAIILMTVYLLGAVIAALIYSYRIYRAEL